MLVPQGSQRAWGPQALSSPSLGACSSAGEGEAPERQLGLIFSSGEVFLGSWSA